MIRPIVFAVSLCFASLGSLQAQIASPGTFSGSGFGLGNRTVGLGNAGGFATGGGFSNGTTNSMNFGGIRPAYSGYATMAPGVVQGIPGVSFYPSAPLNSGVSVGTGWPAVGNNMGMGVMGMGPGFVPGIAPPGFTKEMFGYDIGMSSGDSGYTDFGNAMTYSALGLGFGGMGYGGFGFGGLGYGPMAFGPMNFGYPGAPFVPGVSGMLPADIAAVAANNGAQAQMLPAPTSNVVNVAPGDTDPNASGNNANAANGGNQDRPRTVRRSFLNDNSPVVTANAIRIQNRLHHIKSPNFKNVKVLMAGRTAVLSGTVESKADEEFVLRMVGLEPGVVNTKSELTIQQ